MKKLVTVLFDVDDTLIDPFRFKTLRFSQSVYPDVIPALTQLEKFANLETFSQGLYLYQRLKLKLTRLDSLVTFRHHCISFDKIFTLKHHAKSLNLNHTFIIDNRPDIVTQTSQLGFGSYLIDRHHQYSHQPLPSGVIIINSLTEAVARLSASAKQNLSTF